MSKKRKAEALEDCHSIKDPNAFNSKLSQLNELVDKLSNEIHENNETLTKQIKANNSKLTKDMQSSNETLSKLTNANNQKLMKETESKNNDLIIEINKALDEIKLANDEMNSILSEIKEEKKDLDLTKKRMDAEIEKKGEQITLNVGGHLFTTTKSTLLTIPGTYFHNLLSLTDGDVHFIDRDYKYFESILNYLRDDEDIVHFKSFSQDDRSILMKELEFYKIDLPIFESNNVERRPAFTSPSHDMQISFPFLFDNNNNNNMNLNNFSGESIDSSITLKWNAKKSPDRATFSNNDLTFRLYKVLGSQSCVIGTITVKSFTVKLEGAGSMYIGFMCDDKVFKQSSIDDENNVYLLCKKRGNLRGKSLGKSDSWNRDSASYHKGDYISVILEGATIRFMKNKKDLGVAWKDVKQDMMFPFVVNSGSSASCSLVHNYYQPNQLPNIERSSSLASASLSESESQISFPSFSNTFSININNFNDENEITNVTDSLLKWNAKKSPNSASFSNNDLTSKILYIAGSPSCVIGNIAVNQYTIKIENSADTYIGFIADEKLFQENSIHEDVDIYTFGSRRGSLSQSSHGKCISWDNQLAKCKVGDYVTSILQGTTIRFMKNGEDLGVAFNNVNVIKMFPFVRNSGSSPTCTLIHNYSQLTQPTQLPTDSLLEWDVTKSSSISIFSSDHLTFKIKNIGYDNFGCVIGSSAVMKFTVKIEDDDDDSLQIGFILDEKMHLEQASLYDNFWDMRRFTLDNEKGEIVGVEKGGSKTWNQDAAKFKAGDYITSSILNGNIIFEKNGSSLGVAWSGVKKRSLFPIIIAGRFSSCSIVYDYLTI